MDANGDEFPIRAAAQGNEEAFVTIVRRMMPMIRAQIRRTAPTATEEDDLIQECLLGLLAAVRTCREDGGATFTTYATTCMHNRLVSFLRRQQTQKTVEQPLDEPEDLPDLTDDDPASRVLEQEDALRWRERLLERLTPLEYRVLAARLDDCSYDEIAARLGVSKKAVDNAVQRLRRKLTADR